MPAAERRRPVYLVLALLGAIAFGMLGSYWGWQRFRYYRGETTPQFVAVDDESEADRVALVERTNAYFAALDSAKARVWPLAVGEILLGSAIFLFAMRALGGNASARSMLVQVIVAQAVANGVEHWLLRDVDTAAQAVAEALVAPRIPAESRAAMLHAGYALGLVVQSLGSALIVIALTRRRVREFFDAAGEAVEDQ